MKKYILLCLVMVSGMTYAQTRELQQSIDSFRTVLNQQDAKIKRLQSQVRQLNTLVSNLKSDLNAVPEFAKAEKLPQNSVDSTLLVTKPRINSVKVQPKVNPNQLRNKNLDLKVQNLIKQSKLIRVAGNRTYYMDKHKRRFFLLHNSNKVHYVNLHH